VLPLSDGNVRPVSPRCCCQIVASRPPAFSYLTGNHGFREAGVLGFESSSGPCSRIRVASQWGCNLLTSLSYSQIQASLTLYSRRLQTANVAPNLHPIFFRLFARTVQSKQALGEHLLLHDSVAVLNLRACPLFSFCQYPPLSCFPSPSLRRSQIAGMSMPLFHFTKYSPLSLLPVAVASPFGVVDEGAPATDGRYNCAKATPNGEAEAACIDAHP
jgi:hypothetical protein